MGIVNTPRAERERIEAEIAKAASEIGIREYELERFTEHKAALESQLSALSAPAPWTPKVGDDVWCRGRVIATDPVDEECEVGFTTHFTSTAFVELGNLRPAAPAPELPEWTSDAENWGNALNEAGWTFIEAFPKKDEATNTAVWNYAKTALRSAILKYAEVVELAARTAPVPVEQPDAEPVGKPDGWVLVNEDGVHDVTETLYPSRVDALRSRIPRGVKAKWEPIPLYRHPAPAQKGEPDKFWLSQMEKDTTTNTCVLVRAHGSYIGIGLKDIDGFCAALRAAAAQEPGQ